MACSSMSYTPFAFYEFMLLLIDHLSEGIQIFLTVSDKRDTSCHSHQIKMFGISEQV